MLMQVLAALACLLAALACLLASVLQFAVHRSPDVRDNSLRRAARKIIVVALFVAFLLIVYGLAYSNPLTASVVLVLGLVGLSQLAFALADLLPHLAKEHPEWTSRLNSSP